MWSKQRVGVGLLIAVLIGSLLPDAAAAAKPFTLEQILGSAFPYELVAAKKADRIAWIAYERGLRNVYTAPHWSPDSSKIAFVSNRTDHSFIGVYDLAQQKIHYLAPGVDHDSSLTWSPDGRQVAFVRRPGTPFGQQERGGTRAAETGRG